MSPDSLRLAVRRAAAQRGVLTVATAVLLVVVVLVTACGVTLRVAAQEGVRAGLDRAPATDRVVVVSGDPEDAAGLAAADAAVRARLAEALAPAAPAVQRRTASSTYAVRGGRPQDRVVVGVYAGIRAHARLDAGAWPERPTEVAVPVAAARALGLAVGDEVVLAGQDGSTLRLVVSGTWTPREAPDGWWAEDPQAAAGVRTGGGFRTLGPLLLPEDLPAGGVGLLTDPRVSWVASPRLTALSGDQLETVAERLSRLSQDGPARLADDLPDPRVVTRLDDVLRSLGPALTAARTAVGVPAVLLLALALAALALAGGVLADARLGDVALRESRGTSRRQVVRQAGLEVLTLGLLVAAVALWPAPLLVAATTSARAPGVRAGDVLWTVGAVLVGAVLLARAASTRPAGTAPVTGWRRLVPRPTQVVEVLVLALAVVAGQQALSGGATPLVRSAAPGLLVLAALLLLARLVPWLTRWTRGAVDRARGPVGSVVAWELSRRVQSQRSALLTTGLAAAVAVLLAGLLGSWSTSQDEQGAVATAAETRVAGLDPDTAARVLDAVGGVGGVGGVVVQRRTAGLGSTTGTLLVVPAATAGEVLVSPAPSDWDRLLSRLVPAPGADELPGLVSPALAAQTGDGERVSLEVADATVPVRVVGVVPGFPTTGADEPAVMVDRDALAGLLGGVPAESVSTDHSEVWTGAAASRVREVVPEAEVTTRTQVADELRAGPVGTGLVGGSALALLAAGVLGVLAALTETVAGLRRRRRELTALRAQGLSRRHLVIAVGLERAALLGLSVLAGGTTGWLVLRVLVTHLVTTDTGATPAPAVHVVVPWLLLVATGAVAVLVLVGLALVAAARVAGRPLGPDLRESV